jgi:quinoprotein glucose dehydrogenase
MANAHQTSMLARSYLWLVAGLCLLIGAVLTVGGIWLIVLGGSWYYALAGAALVVSGILLWRWQMAGVWLYLIVFAATVVWALWERGLTLWPQVPRILAPTILLILVLLTIPIIRRRSVRLHIGGRYSSPADRYRVR